MTDNEEIISLLKEILAALRKPEIPTWGMSGYTAEPNFKIHIYGTTSPCWCGEFHGGSLTCGGGCGKC